MADILLIHGLRDRRSDFSMLVDPLTRFGSVVAPDAPGQLYNLKDDPGERTNLYFEHPEKVKEMKELLDQSLASGRSSLEAPGGRA